MLLEKDAIQKMVEAIDSDGTLGSVAPKLLRWNFKNNLKTNDIDSCGVKLYPGLNFTDACQGKQNKGKCNKARIIGPSGAAGMFRIFALQKIAENGQYFDELMFMYKEDCDLAYRMFLGGFKCKFLNNAVIYHDRTTSSGGRNYLSIIKNRKGRDKNIKAWSFLNQQIIFVKYWGLQSSFNKLNVIWYQVKALVFILLFERFLLKEYANLFKIIGKIKKYKA